MTFMGTAATPQSVVDALLPAAAAHKNYRVRQLSLECLEKAMAKCVVFFKEMHMWHPCRKFTLFFWLILRSKKVSVYHHKIYAHMNFQALR